MGFPATAAAQRRGSETTGVIAYVTRHRWCATPSPFVQSCAVYCRGECHRTVVGQLRAWSMMGSRGVDMALRGLIRGGCARDVGAGAAVVVARVEILTSQAKAE